MLFDLDKKDTLIIIPARGGSQRVPNKNLRMLNNQPLIVHSIRECLKIKNAITIVSTDSQNIAEISSQNGAIYLLFVQKILVNQILHQGQ